MEPSTSMVKSLPVDDSSHDINNKPWTICYLNGVNSDLWKPRVIKPPKYSSNPKQTFMIKVGVWRMIKGWRLILLTQPIQRLNMETRILSIL